MKIIRHVLDNIPKVYSLTRLPDDNNKKGFCFAAGSEVEGPLRIFAPRNERPYTLADTPGGFITLCTFTTERQRYLVAATRFFPVFNAADCRIVLYPLKYGKHPEPVEVMRLPYTHRMAVVQIENQSVFIGSTLCTQKDFTEDWSHPGNIVIAPIPSNSETSWEGNQIITGLTHNHGLAFARLQSGTPGGFLISADEGLFYLRIPRSITGEWICERLVDGPHSDACAFKPYAKASPDIVAISPFHGNILRYYRKETNGWRQSVIADDLQTGHVVWAGRLLEGPAILVGSRGGRAELRLYRPTDDSCTEFQCEILDEGVGATQILVYTPEDKRAVLIIASHATDSVLRYDLTN